MAYVYPSIDTLNKIVKHSRLVKNNTFAERVQATPTCQTSRMTYKDPLDVYSTHPLDNIHTKSNRNKHTIDSRNECRCYLIQCSTAAACLLVSEKYKK